MSYFRPRPSLISSIRCMLSGVCFFVVCLQLQECIRYADYFEQHVGNQPLDMFFFKNGHDLPLQAHHHDLSKMLIYDNALPHHTTKHLHNTALDWVAYFHYRYNATCEHLLKFEHDILFLEETGFDYGGMFTSDLKTHSNSTLIVYRRGCKEDVVTTFNIVVDKQVFMEFLDLYTLNAVLQGSESYSTGGLNEFINTYSEVTGNTDFHKARVERLYMRCEEDEEGELPADQYSFIHCTHALRKTHPACLAHYEEANETP